MKRLIATGPSVLILIAFPLFSAHAASSHANFDVAVYVRAQEVDKMKDLNWLEARWGELEKQLKVDKVYLETHRDGVVPDEETISKARQFFQSRGIRVSGGIATVFNERDHYRTFCYTTAEQRRKIKEIVEYTARLFDEVILDDFFFTSCKCESCIRAKGDKSWTRFRLELMEEVSRDLVITPARAVNPKVKLTIKYPNWYEHFQGLGYNLEAEHKLFDAIYTGTETRDPIRTQQHLQPYQSYLIVRYLTNVKPGGNSGGWVDPAARGNLDRYAEQLWLTLFAKAPEITLFDFRQLIEPVRESDRAPWQGQGMQTSFDFDKMTESIPRDAGTSAPVTLIARSAGYVFDQVDGFLGKLGNPVGIKSYKPYHSTGEDFLHNYLGMIGVPMDIVPDFPTDAKTVFLAESAKFDPTIVDKIKKHLTDGKNVVITSGLLKALQGKGIEDIVELECSDRKVVTKEFMCRRTTVRSETPVVIPLIRYLTNDAWELIGCLTQGTGYPLLIQADYAKGVLYVLVIPDDLGDLYKLPPEVLTQIKEVLAKDLPVRLDSAGQVSLFVYDNDTFIVESFLPQATDVRIVTDKRIGKLRDMLSGEVISGEAPAVAPMPSWRGGGDSDRLSFRAQIKPHSYRVFSAEQTR